VGCRLESLTILFIGSVNFSETLQNGRLTQDLDKMDPYTFCKRNRT